ncbi:MAG: 4Fe-4S dicluster domain-containing protein [Panacagrimonas sp.]
MSHELETTMSNTGDDCKHDAGSFIPIIDRNRCEGKADCVRVCPYTVFTIGKVPQAERRPLSLIGKAKGFAHGWEQAFATHAEACRACGHCVSACPEWAITLRRAERSQ